MGTSLEVWRARIGSYTCNASFGSSCTTVLNLEIIGRSCLILSLILTLLMIGNIEWNPGPVYKCQFCSIENLDSLPKYVKHQSTHSFNSNFFYLCPFPSCVERYTSQNGLVYHLKSVHSTSYSVKTSSEGKADWDCVLCSVCGCAFSSCYMFCKHFQHHIQNDKLKLPCPLNYICNRGLLYGGLDKDAKKESDKLGQHLSLYHPGWRTGDAIEPPIPPPSQPTLEEQHYQSVQSDSSPSHQQPEVSSPAHSEEEVEDDSSMNSCMIQKLIFTFYLMLEAKLLLPEKQVQEISEKLAILSDLLQDHTVRVLNRALKKVNLSNDDISLVINELCLSDEFYNVHHKTAPGPNVTSDHYRKNYYDSTFPSVEPKQVPLDLDPNGENVVYVSITETLNILLKDSLVQKQVRESFQRCETPGHHTDFYDGSVYKGRTISKQKHISLFIFQDGFSTPNPLGSAKNLHQLIGVYFVIANLVPYLRSKLKFIHLVSLFYEKLLKNENYGFECFRPLFKELETLRTKGIVFDGERIPVFVHFLIGDNLGAHMIGGFIGSFSSSFFCRFCEVTREEFLKDPTVIKKYRSREDYNQALDELDNIKKTRPEVVTHRGVKTDSPFNHEIDPELHVCDPSLPSCLGHDLMEGVIALDLREIISLLIKAGWFTYKTLNQRIASFKYAAPDLANKPPPVGEDKEKLTGHAVQNWCLLRLLPFLLEGLIKDPSSDVWKLYLKLKELVEYACSPYFSTEDLEKFDQLVISYLRDRSSVLKTPPKPKHHFLRHYSSLVPLVGPIIHLWTLRFESKHSLFKNIARICKNYINLCMTLAKKHQLYQSYLATGLLALEGISSRKRSACTDYLTHVLSEIENAEIPRDYVHYDSLVINDIVYKREMYVLLGCLSEKNDISVGKIEAIIAHGMVTKFVLRVFSASYSLETGVHHLDLTKSSVHSVSVENLKYPIPHPVYDFGDDLCLSLKYHLQCN